MTPALIRWRWRGDGWLPGVPARDLTAAEAAACGADLWAEALALDLYEEVDHAGT